MRKGEDGMKNVEMTVAGNILTIKVDLSKEFGPSSSKKSIIIASTEGNVSVPDRKEMINVNYFFPSTTIIFPVAPPLRTA